VHTHSTYATAFAQSGRDITPYGTTHADAFYGSVPCSRELTDEEISDKYEWNTGKVIAETVSDPDAIPAILVKNHGVFTWGASPEKAVENAVTLEEVAKMAQITESLNAATPRIKQTLLDKHYLRKHGKNAYYGQKK
jgi:L-ribulose-5-phosphate 4-epimerase